MSLRGLSPRFWVAAALVAFVFLVALVGPLIVSTNPDATVGGLYEEPQCCGALILGADNEGQSVIANLVYGTRTSLIVGTNRGPHRNRDRPAGRSRRRLPRRLGRRCAERHRERRPGHPGDRDRDLGFGVAPATQPLHPGAGDRVHWLVLGSPCGTRAVQQHPNPRTHRRGQALRSRVLVNPAPRRPALPALVCRYGWHPADLRCHLVRVHAEHARPGRLGYHQPGHDALLGHSVGVGADRSLVGVHPTDTHADLDRFLIAAAAVQPQ